MEAVASPPLLASFFLSPPHPTSAVAAACCSRRNTSCAHPPSPGGLEAAVAEVKAAPDPVPALISLQWFPCSIRRGGPPAIDYIDRRCFLQSISNVSSISMDRVIEASRGRQATNANAMLSRVDLLCEIFRSENLCVLVLICLHCFLNCLTVRRGWSEYVQQPVLPANLANVLVCFNVALAPGALMTTFLIHQGEMTRMVTIADKARLVNGVCGVGRREAVGDWRVQRLVGGGAHRQVPATAVTAPVDKAHLGDGRFMAEAQRLRPSLRQPLA
ncbi:hypothetical protein OsI_22393 [Oryza sativa Indica Group]|uniref:Solute carrier family 40 member n=1 Tax=Oryza sativa subsp. indica TaxID=39946 RepID=B8B0D3_ORYSI|nr:hypothetical protein OsI_22393 [Oryza sativa Indica Group]